MPALCERDETKVIAGFFRNTGLGITFNGKHTEVPVSVSFILYILSCNVSISKARISHSQHDQTNNRFRPPAPFPSHRTIPHDPHVLLVMQHPTPPAPTPPCILFALPHYPMHIPAHQTLLSIRIPVIPQHPHLAPSSRHNDRPLGNTSPRTVPDGVVQISQNRQRRVPSAPHGGR